jgi:hypothetical protein
MLWFRMYAEAIDDSKLRILAYEDRWHFVALLCCKAQGILDTPNVELRLRRLCIKFGMDSVELQKVMERLIAVGLVRNETRGETKGSVSFNFQPTNWKKRQFVSDSSTKRVQAFRKRFRNVPETAQNRSESEQIRNPPTPLTGGQAGLPANGGRKPRQERDKSLGAWRSVTALIDEVAARTDGSLTWRYVMETCSDSAAVQAAESVGFRLIADRDRFTTTDLQGRFREAYERTATVNL